MQRKIEMTSMVRHAGIKPVVENQPFVGLRPTILLWPAGTRPDPAVSVPKLKVQYRWQPPPKNLSLNHR